MHVRGAGVDVRGRVTFVRPAAPGTGTVQIDVERSGHLDNATLLPSGAMTAFTDGVPRQPSAEEARVLEVLAAAFAWPGRVASRTLVAADAAEVVLGDGARFRLEVGKEVPVDRPHGG